MQGTIATFDPTSRSGTLLLDDGTELAFDAPAFDASGLRKLRLGQRVAIEAGEGGRVRQVRIPGVD
ncbi:cold-shock protein [Actinoplanes sp. Pm04-4]|jgi:cold shock CspA family protein|uniref:Cold-shock protein n=1 Tax=Paractinoplanes pyxinae TaxID=2997416 RepID=A0ABT4B1H4_9ACTN|nr:cold-shock protein [Actinoplanes pyxinae]MCY1140363.1 cold-shock protein [Actinoplanes pyxinae]